MFLVNSCMGHFSATQQRFDRKGLHVTGYPFSRSYGVNLPSSLTAFLSSALGYSPHPPVSVLVRTPKSLPRRFSRRLVLELRLAARHHLWAYACGFSYMPPSGLYAHLSVRSHFFPRPSIGMTRPGGTGILTCLPSTTPFGLVLGSD